MYLFLFQVFLSILAILSIDRSLYYCVASVWLLQCISFSCCNNEIINKYPQCL